MESFLRLKVNAHTRSSHVRSPFLESVQRNPEVMAEEPKFLIFGKSGWIGGLVAEELERQVRATFGESHHRFCPLRHPTQTCSIRAHAVYIERSTSCCPDTSYALGRSLLRWRSSVPATAVAAWSPASIAWWGDGHADPM